MSNIRYANEDHLIQQSSLSLLYISTSRYENDWHSSLHSHQCAELFYVISGRGEFKLEELSFPVRQSDLVIINPNVQHTETATPNNPLEYIVVGMEGGEYLLNSSEDTRYCCFSCGAASAEILGMMQEMRKELLEKKKHHGIVAGNILENLCIKLLRLQSLSLERSSSQRKRSSKECVKVKHYIDHHFKENITLDMLSDVAHINKYYMVHAFTQEMGISPINYLIEKRIEESRHMLLNTAHNISEISQILGFSSPSYFSQSFSRLNKMSPREYRMKQDAQTAASRTEI